MAKLTNKKARRRHRRKERKKAYGEPEILAFLVLVITEFSIIAK